MRKIIVPLVCGLAGLLVGGCTVGSSPSSPKHSTDIVFMEAVTTPATIFRVEPTRPTTDGGVVSVPIVNKRSQVVRISRIENVADAGLDATYIGHSKCARGCAGAGHWNAETQAQVERGKEGVYPVVLHPLPQLVREEKPTESLIFRLEVISTDGIDRLLKECLYLRAIIVTLDDASRATVSAPADHYIAAIQAEEPRPAGYRSCQLP